MVCPSNSYGGGTRPWAQSSNYEPQCTHDGKIEVIGLTTYQLVSVNFHSLTIVSVLFHSVSKFVIIVSDG